jgi:hypothetical protein
VRRIVPHACERCGGPIEWADHHPYDERPERRRHSYLCDHHGRQRPDPRRVTVEDLALIAEAAAQQQRWDAQREARESAYREQVIRMATPTTRTPRG